VKIEFEKTNGFAYVNYEHVKDMHIVSLVNGDVLVTSG